MAPRLQLHDVLIGITDHVYFQPPENIVMQYPCIVYARESGDSSRFANNRPYQHVKRYQVTVIDRNPDSDLPDQVQDLPLCQFVRFFTADNLNHFVFNLFF
jgi:hypothetical protein